MNHKRGKPKHLRAGCLWCKPHKDERAAKVPRKVPHHRPLEAGRADCAPDPVEIDREAMAAELTDYEESIEFLTAEEYTL